ncbi:uracil-DNA glycosylase [Rhizobium sp. FY34]|uniref:uracil-DNA glycosylase n=1 Tax=Rhizobium sp. FY34 TaxID=2562309 RepID=UPI0010BFFB83|nr:uracil-DNA glycosylase [Rhizobium sp. FY34]
MISARTLAPAEVAALLHFYADAGVEWLLEDEPVDRIAAFAAQQAAHASQKRERTAQPAEAPQAAARRAPGGDRNAAAPPVRAPASATALAIPDAEAIASARLAASSAHSLEELKLALEAFGGCNLKNGARSTVFTDGNPAAGVMIIGPMPTADDDRDGVPFSGRQGQLLDRMLAAIGLSRQTALISNVVPWRPPGNRPPSAVEIDICRPFIERQIELAAPKHLLLLGNFTARYFFGEDGTIFNLRGEWRDLTFGNMTVPALASLHPQDLLTAPANKALAWRDLMLFRSRLPG